METKQELTHSVVLGIAGNSPGYLAQTGEISAFSEQQKAQQQEAQRPRALFPMFVRQPGESYLGQMPFSSSKLVLPEEPDAKVQMEPEIAIKCGVTYTEQGQVAELTPFALTLINDATYRNKAVSKLAEKKTGVPLVKELPSRI